MSLPAQWVALEDAVHAWVVSGSGLTAARVLWAQQRAPQPGAAYISLRILGLRQVGHDWTDVVDNPTPTAGAEILHRARGVRELTLGLQCFAAAATGTAGAVALLEAVRAAAALPTRRDALRAAGLGILGFGSVTSIDGFVGGHGIFEPRATLDVRCHVASQVSEAGTFIEFVEVERLAPAPSQVTFVPEEP